jgi:hypothetical protein
VCLTRQLRIPFGCSYRRRVSSASVVKCSRNVSMLFRAVSVGNSNTQDQPVSQYLARCIEPYRLVFPRSVLMILYMHVEGCSICKVPMSNKLNDKSLQY